MKIHMFPLEWEGEKRIGIRPMGLDRAFPGAMKQIKGSRWTPDVRCWYIPYDPEAYGHLKRLFGEGQVTPVSEHPIMNAATKTEQVTQNRDPLRYKDELFRLEERLRLLRYSYNDAKMLQCQCRAPLPRCAPNGHTTLRLSVAYH